MTHIVVDKSTDNAKPHTTCFLSPYQRQRKCSFSERDPDRDTKKEQALYITFSPSDWFIPQIERFWLAITTRNSHRKNSESSEATVKLNVYSRKYINFNWSVTANIHAELQSFCGKTYTLEEAFWKGQRTGVCKNRHCKTH